MSVPSLSVSLKKVCSVNYSSRDNKKVSRGHERETSSARLCSVQHLPTQPAYDDETRESRHAQKFFFPSFLVTKKKPFFVLLSQPAYPANLFPLSEQAGKVHSREIGRIHYYDSSSLFHLLFNKTFFHIPSFLTMKTVRSLCLVMTLLLSFPHFTSPFPSALILCSSLHRS